MRNGVSEKLGNGLDKQIEECNGIYRNTHQQELFCVVRFEVLTAVLPKIQIFWDVMLCWMSGSKCFEGLYLWVQAVERILHSLTMTMNVLPSFKTSGNTHSMTQRPISAGFDFLFCVVYVSAVNSTPVNTESVMS